MNISELRELFHYFTCFTLKIDLWVVYPFCIGYRRTEVPGDEHCNYCLKGKNKKGKEGEGKKMKKDAVFLHFF